MAASAAVPFKNGTRFALKDVPGELIVYTVGEAKSPIYPKMPVGIQVNDRDWFDQHDCPFAALCGLTAGNMV